MHIYMYIHTHTYVSVCTCMYRIFTFLIILKSFINGLDWDPNEIFLLQLIDIYLLSSLCFLNSPPSPLSPTLTSPWKFVVEETRFVPQSFRHLRNVADFLHTPSFNLFLTPSCSLSLAFRSREPIRFQISCILFRPFQRCYCGPLSLPCLLLGCISHYGLCGCCLIVWHFVSEI